MPHAAASEAYGAALQRFNRHQGGQRVAVLHP